MWTMTLGSGVTAAKSWKATPIPTTNSGGVMEIDITVTPGGAWNITLDLPSIEVIPQRSYDFGYWWRATSIGADIVAEMTVNWGVDSGDPDQTLGGELDAINTWYNDVGGNYTFYLPPGFFSFSTSTEEANISVVISGTGSYVGKVYLGAFSFGVPAVYLSEPNQGTLIYDAVWQEEYLG